jgi:hypothetical protein
MLELQKKPLAGAVFPVTDWTLIDAAETELGAGPAHERFCKLYWYPIYAFVCRSWPWLSRDDVMDATQEFFTVRLEKRDLGAANEYPGRFHHWLMGAVSHQIKNRGKYEYAQKRDRRKLIWLDALAAEARLRLEPKTTLDPLRQFERDLALGVLERALDRLAGEYAARGRAAYFARVVRLIVPGESDSSYGDLEKRWGIPRDALKVRIRRMRERLAHLVGCELGVSDGDRVAQQASLVWLFQALDRFDPDREPRLLAAAKAVVPLSDNTRRVSSGHSESTSQNALV